MTDDFDQYPAVNGHHRRIRKPLEHEPKDKSFSIQCVLCSGKGLVGDGIFEPKPCPVRGCKSGWITFEGKPEHYKPCGACGGTGREENKYGPPKVCEKCGGTGLVKV